MSERFNQHKVEKSGPIFSDFIQKNLYYSVTFHCIKINNLPKTLYSTLQNVSKLNLKNSR